MRLGGTGPVRPGLRAGVLTFSAVLVLGTAFVVANTVSDRLSQAAVNEAVRHAESVVQGLVSPMFTGMSVLIAGALMALIGLALLASLAGSAFRLPGGGKATLVIITLVAFVVGATNLPSLYATGDSSVVTPEYGLFLLTAGALIGLVGVIAASSKGRS